MKRFLTLLITIGIVACNSEPKIDEQKSVVETEDTIDIADSSTVKEFERKRKSGDLDPAYEALLDSVFVSWVKLSFDEKQRIEDMERLLKEASYLPSYNSQKLKEMDALLEELKTYSYKMENIPSFEVVARNDQRIEEITNQIFHYVDQSLDKSKNYPLIETLKEDIKKSLYESSLELSSNFSHSMLERNNYIIAHKEKLEELGYTDLVIYNTFFEINSI